jgi:hypothetical protein
VVLRHTPLDDLDEQVGKRRTMDHRVDAHLHHQRLFVGQPRLPLRQLGQELAQLAALSVQIRQFASNRQRNFAARHRWVGFGLFVHDRKNCAILCPVSKNVA